MISFVRLNPQFIDGEWPKVSGFLADGLLYSEGEITIEQLRMLCGRGQVDVFVTLKDGKAVGAFAVEPVVYPNFRVANVISAGGRGVFTQECWPHFTRWLRDFGYSKVQGYCRPSVARLLRRIDGFRTSYELVRADL